MLSFDEYRVLLSLPVSELPCRLRNARARPVALGEHDRLSPSFSLGCVPHTDGAVFQHFTDVEFANANLVGLNMPCKSSAAALFSALLRLIV